MDISKQVPGSYLKLLKFKYELKQNIFAMSKEKQF